MKMKIEFLEEKIKWQEKMIGELENERDFLREQVLGKAKGQDVAPFNVKQEVHHHDHNDDTTSSSRSLSESDEPVLIDNKQKKRKKVAHHSLRHHIRVKGPEEVISRYNQVLKTFRKVRTMSEAFHRHNVDRGTIAATAPIAELQIADPKTYSTLVFDPAMETLLAFAKRCASSVNPEIKRSIEDLKARGIYCPF
ncbi:coiled-coil domain-containing protein 106-like [Chanodichthys erythropterus]|uniref:coiled-coil domain-containing protein 106-like n=1 Tax=Chanodichthys erythropterus TaxID=933992 RepID=UPI00351E58C9